MTSAEARRDPVGPPSVRTQRALVETAVERLESALYRIQTGADPELARLDALTSIAASLLRLAGQPPTVDRVQKLATRVENVERAAIAATNALRGHRAELDRLDEQIGGR